MKGRVEADETYIGGAARFMHKNRKTGKRGMVGKTAVLGLLEREAGDKPSRVRCKVMKRVRVPDLDPAVRANVEKGSEIITDKLSSYYKLSDEYVHQVIDHAVSYAEGHVHVNCLENFWSLLKRALKGTYVNVEPFHLFRYLDEQAFRFNERKDNDRGRFLKTIANFAGKRLMYSKLIGQAGGVRESISELPKWLIGVITAVLGALGATLIEWLSPDKLQWSFPARLVLLTLGGVVLIYLILGQLYLRLWLRSRTREGFGVLWNRRGNPVCSKCRAPLTKPPRGLGT